MKKIIVTGILFISVFTFSQKYYTKIKSSKVNKERLEIGHHFISEYLSKCESKDYSNFKNFILSKNLDNKLFENRGKSCENILNRNGKITVKALNSAYIHNYSKNIDPVEMFVFDIDTEKKSDLKYITVWVYHDQNVIGGIWISKEIPLHKNEKKQIIKESAL